MAGPILFKVMVVGVDEKHSLGAATCFDDVPPLSPVCFQISAETLFHLSTDAEIGAWLRAACTAIRDNREFSPAQRQMNDFIQG